MRALKLTLFIIALVTLSTQTFRHIYVKYIDPKFSVLDKYKDSIETQVDNTKNIKELEILYKENNDKINKIKKENPDYEKNKEYTDLVSEKDVIRSGIRKAESLTRSKFELIFYWFFGLASIIIGIIVYILLNKWIGLAGIITGLSEMIVWTSPLYHRMDTFNFIDLLNLKLLLSVISWVILLILWAVNEKIIDKSEKI